MNLHQVPETLTLRRALWAGRIMSALVVIALVADGTIQLFAPAQIASMLQETGFAMDLTRVVGPIILACASKGYFADALRLTGAKPLLWTTNLMAPEAYILAAAVDGWLKKETDEQIRTRAARAYDQYQHCGQRSANNLFATGW